MNKEKLEAWIASKIDTTGDQYIEAAYVQGARSMIPLVLRLQETLEYLCRQFDSNHNGCQQCRDNEHLAVVISNALADADKMIGG
jgi:hypothetical protein